MKVSWACFTDKGIKEQNEDAVGATVPERWLQKTKGSTFVISDGVSSAEAGKEASEICVNELLDEYYKTPDLWSIKTSAHRTLTMLNRLLYGKNREFPDAERGYVATLCCLILKAHTANLFHIGDSRVYRVRDSQLEQLTEDHHVSAGDNAQCLARAMGVDVGLAVDFKSVDLQPGDRFILTTDGVHDFVSDERLLAAVSGVDADYQECQHKNLVIEACCKELVTEALENGSDDNVSCEIVLVHDITYDDEHYFEETEEQLPFPPSLEPGMRIDGYRIKDIIHASNRSQVYLVEDEESGQAMIMKTPSVNYEDDLEYIDRFIMEAWVGTRIDHQNVVKVIPVKREKKFLYYLMEKLDGITLEQWMLRYPPPSGGQMIKIAKQIIDGVKAFHEKEIIHRDIKPGNIILLNDGQVKIVDFGSVYVPSVAEIQGDIRQDELLGTVNYTDPEYRKGHKPGIKGDLFSVATLIYEMLTGDYPYGNKLQRCDTPKSFNKLKYVNSFKHNKDIPVWFDGALRTALEVNPGKRHHDLFEFYGDLTKPNPYFLSEEYLRDLEASLPAVPVWKVVALLWIGSLILGLLVFVV